MIDSVLQFLSGRDRQIVEIVYARRSVSAKDIMSELPEPPSYSAVRSMVNRLVDKGVLGRRKDGKKWVYEVLTPRQEVRQGELNRLIDRFFDGSRGAAIIGLLGHDERELSDSEVEKIMAMIKQKSGQK
jgi:predicted transcriptional regulator